MYAFNYALYTCIFLISGACAQHTSGYQYNTYELIPTITHGVHLDFSVLAASDAYLLLTTDGNTSLPYYEITIGSGNNQMSSIRSVMAGTDIVRVNTPNILDPTQYKSFWLRFYGGVIDVGRTGESTAFLSHAVGGDGLNTVGFSSWIGTTANWIVYTGSGGT